MPRIAIIYASRYGTTKSVAEKLQEIAQAAGLEVTLTDAKNALKLDLTTFDGVVVGAGIQIGKIPSSMNKFLKKKRAVLNLFRNKFALFICCGTAKDPAGAETASEKYILPLLAKFKLKPGDGMTAAFGGCYDLRPESTFGKLKSGIIRKMLEEEEPGRYNLNELIDLRDWSAIEGWFKTYLANF